MTDDEGDASISQVETADFGDHSTASGESKRNGHGGRKSNGAEVSHSVINSSFVYHLCIIHLSFIHHFFRFSLCCNSTVVFIILYKYLDII
jgi:hypothetical protein